MNFSVSYGGPNLLTILKHLFDAFKCSSPPVAGHTQPCITSEHKYHGFSFRMNFSVSYGGLNLLTILKHLFDACKCSSPPVQSDWYWADTCPDEMADVGKLNSCIYSFCVADSICCS
jgi:hypothetical protein